MAGLGLVFSAVAHAILFLLILNFSLFLVDRYIRRKTEEGYIDYFMETIRKGERCLKSLLR